MMPDQHTLHAIALSIASSPGLLRLWDRMKESPPREIFASLEASGTLATQEMIAYRYAGRPMDAARMIAGAAAQKGIRVITLWDGEYPPLLKEISKPPVVLYCRGALPRSACISIVGTRGADATSRGIARRIAGELAKAGFTVASGMAVGIDREAHLGALGAGGATIGVLANGIDIAYPAQNRDLYHDIMRHDGSGLISEYPPGIRAGKWTFARRNRIISGLSAATVIVQAGEKSGALITARYAVEQNREVFVCAGPAYDARYAGCHSLIRSGATLISSAHDITEELIPHPPARENPLPPAAPQTPPCEPGSLEEKILAIAAEGCLDIDAIARRAGANIGAVREAVSMLELSGAIARDGNRLLIPPRHTP